MESTTKEKIKNACQQEATILVQETDLISYQVTTDGGIEKLAYDIVALTGCNCFGCSIKTELNHTEIIGNCADLSFLQNS
jgi:hypothetical protein